MTAEVTILSTLFVLSVFALISLFLLNRYLQNHIQRQLDAMAKEIVDKYVPVEVELINGSLVTYHKVTQEFICQGNSYDEWAENWLRRYPTKIAIASAAHTELLLSMKDAGQAQ